MTAEIKRIIIVADLHCGSKVGLTHPDFDARPNDTKSANYKLYLARRAYWKWYEEKALELGQPTALIVNGDAVEGKGEKSGSTELITADRGEQTSMAIAALEIWKAPRIFMSYGTPYHTGASEDWENEIAKSEKLNVEKIGGHDWIDVNGLVFDYKHFVGASSIPHGRFASIAKERLWNLLWAEHDEYPKADIIIRSHVHYCRYCGADWLALTTPALQGPGTKYGSRKCSGTVEFGLIHFDVLSKGEWDWKRHILRRRMSKLEVVKV